MGLLDEIFDEPLEADGFLFDLTKPTSNAAMEVPEQEEGKAATRSLLKKRAAKGKDIGVLPPGSDEDVIQTEGQTGQESLKDMEDKADDDTDATPRR
jgi:hypothetical protein